MSLNMLEWIKYYSQLETNCIPPKIQTFVGFLIVMPATV